jgi:hypothetical protein
MSIVKYHPVSELEEATTAYKELNVKIKSKHLDLWKKANSLLNDIKTEGMTKLINRIQNNTKVFRNLADNMYEMRIPPQSNRGVIRIYFSFAEDSSHIIILKVEYKNETKTKQIKIAKHRKRGM